MVILRLSRSYSGGCTQSYAQILEVTINRDWLSPVLQVGLVGNK